MSGTNDESMTDLDGMSDAPPTASSGYGVGEAMDVDAAASCSGDNATANDAESSQPPHSYPTRTQSQNSQAGSTLSTTNGNCAGYTSSDGVVNSDARGPLAAVSDDTLLERALKICTSDPDGPVSSGEPGIGGTVLVEHCVRVKATINKVYEKPHSGSICRSPERPDLQMSQEEAYGRVVVDLIVGPTDLVPKELREIGKRVDNHATREKRSHDNAKENAKDKRKNARTAARKDEVKAAVLDETLAAIETSLEGKRTERLAKVVDIGLPDPKTVVVDGPAPVHWRAQRAALEDEDDDELPTTIDEAEELAYVAALKADALDAQYDAATNDALRAARALQRLPNEAASPAWGLEGSRVPESTRLHRARQRETWIRAYAKHQAFKEALPALQQNADCLRAQADLLAEYAQELKLAEYQRRLSELMIKEAQHAETCEQLERAERADRDELCGRVRMDAQRVWGSVHGTAAAVPPKVFNVNGMSAEDVAALSPEVSQQLTSAEERLSLAQPAPAVVEGVAVGSAVSFGGPAVVAGVAV
jgi:hypothetical protein